jgi:predicted RNA binding protein YcfA (HicA-like mRNA interferase family)
MKRSALIKHLRKNGCKFYREGSNHTLYINPANNKISTIPRHTEILDYLAKKICTDLEIKPLK